MPTSRTQAKRAPRASEIEPAPTRLPPWEEVVAYQNDSIVRKFREHYPVSREQAQALFHETKKWLWLCAASQWIPGAPSMIVTDEIRIIDEMWHTFILFTREYHQFCARFFGAYIHHAPATEGDKEALNIKRFLAGKRRQYEFILKELGEETLARWYVEYPERFGPEFFGKPVQAPRQARPRSAPSKRRVAPKRVSLAS